MKRRKYLGPSFLYDAIPALNSSSHTCARLLPSLFAIWISVLFSSAGSLTPIRSSFLSIVVKAGLYGTLSGFANTFCLTKETSMGTIVEHWYPFNVGAYNMTRQSNAFRANNKLARTLWGKLPQILLRTLKELTERYSLSVAAGDLQMLDGKWYVTHAGLLRLAKRNRCSGIRVQPVREFCDASTGRWVFKATLYKSPKSKGFVGYGDADPSNVSSLVRGAEMRMAETRAVNRALRKAYGIGLCSVEEIGSFPPSAKQVSGPENASALIQKNIPSNGQPRLRDRLCQLIRQYSLDPTLVKHYAADFCETENLRDATRDRVEAFIKNLAEQAVKDRPGLLCQLNSYAQPQEVKS